MKKFLIVTFVLLFSVVTFAQKAERENIRKGNKEYRQQKFSTAEQRYKAALKVNPHSKESIYNLANTSYKQGRWDEALKGYEKYVSVEKQNPLNLSKAFYNMGNVYLRKHPSKDQKENYLEKAIDSYKQSLRINPNDEEARYNLAVAQKLRQDNGGGGGKNNQNKDKNKDKNKDQNKQQNKDQDKNNQNKNQNKQDQQKQNNQNKQEQMSQDNADQILKAIEQDEKQTQDRVKQMKVEQRKQKNNENRRNNKDW